MARRNVEIQNIYRVIYRSRVLSITNRVNYQNPLSNHSFSFNQYQHNNGYLSRLQNRLLVCHAESKADILRGSTRRTRTRFS